jgi:hypothetical protein
MATESRAAADPALIRTAHAAFRRDLVRTRIVAADEVSGGRRAALGDHVLWLMGALHRHHEAEDSLYPLVIRQDPTAAPLFATRDAEHGAITPVVGRLVEAARDFRDGAPGRVMLAALTELDSVLLPHLEREEAELVPAAARSLGPEQWRRWLRERESGPASPAQRALEVDWLLDGADPRTRASVLAGQPAVPRLLRFARGGSARIYARRFRELWAGTPAALVPALTLQNHADWS